LPDGVNVPAIDAEPWSYDPSNPKVNWDKLLEWQRERIATSLEYKTATATQQQEDDDDADSIPF